MYKRLYLAVILILNNLITIAQSVYMHEAQADARNGEGFSLKGLFLLLVIIGIVWFVKQLFKEKKK